MIRLTSLLQNLSLSLITSCDSITSTSIVSFGASISVIDIMSLDVNISEPDEFNCIELHTVIQEMMQLINVKEFEYHVEFLSGKGDNYVANLFRLTLKDTGGEKRESIKVIVKTLINTTRQELFHELHRREVFVYKEVVPKYHRILQKFNIDKTFNLPYCYVSRTEPGKEVIILEDLEERGFLMDRNKYESVDYEHACLVFRKLAKFHALSFILEKEDSSAFERLKSNCKDLIFDNMFLTRSKLKQYFIDSFCTSTKVIIDDGIRSRLLEKISPTLIERMKQYLQPRKYNVLCHGDFWINNILFQHKEGKPVDLIFLDFQAMRYACPVTDIMYFTYLCTDVDFRSKHLIDLQNLYYETLGKVIGSCDMDVNGVYPREAYEEDLREFTNFGLMTALVELKMLTIKQEEEYLLKDVQVGQDIDSVIGELRLYALRVNQLVNEFSAKGYLDKL